MRRIAWVALALVAGSCGFPEYQFSEETPRAAVDECDPSPCQNGGTCATTDAGFACLCPDGFRGERCETDVDDCEDDPCQNGGVCVDGVDEYTCDCPLGFDGRHCEDNLDDCSPNPCKNGGACVDGVADYACECPEGFSGDTCAGALAPTCLSVLESEPGSQSDVYSIDPDGPGAGKAPVDVYCDMETEGGGWTLVGREAAGSAGTLRFLAAEEGLPNQIASGSGNGLLGLRFAGLYQEVRIAWSGSSSGFIAFRPARELFVNEVDTAIAVSEFATSDATLASWVASAGAAIFCRASQSVDVRPGDTSWAIKPATDMYVECGCSSSSWTGQGAYYGGSLNATSCSGFGGGWAAIRGNGEAKGGITAYESAIWIR